MWLSFYIFPLWIGWKLFTIKSTSTLTAFFLFKWSEFEFFHENLVDWGENKMPKFYIGIKRSLYWSRIHDRAIQALFRWGFWAHLESSQAWGFWMDFLNHREGVWFSFMFPPFSFTETVRDSVSFEETEISRQIKTFVWISSKN